ncbi:helix-turn-helix domain-containing protein [Carnobacterium maltaromaticum]|uniref:helix-turn-helix domain-containing protein n=1 Tax=Carnobacterium maltaromaticum TaxID=2751 RepID=UPI00295EFF5E|nr:helix-turn-helix domain-containing protein [Carnobacterium maltaromaticum]
MLNFIDSDYNRQIRVLYFIKSSFKPVTVDEIADYAGSSNKTISTILPVIKNDIAKLNFDLKRTQDRKYYLESEVKGIPISLDEYILFCGKRSLVFSIIEELFHKEKINTVDFCNKRYISQATFSRGKKKLIELLATCDLKLPTYLTEGIIGNEYKIRNFYFNFFTNFYSSFEWPFEEHIKKEFAIFFESKLGESISMISMNQKTKFYYLLYIIKKRIMQGDYSREETVSFEGIDNYEHYYQFMKDFLSTYKIINPKTIKNETNFFICEIYTQEIIELDLGTFFSNDRLELSVTHLWMEEFKKQFKQILTEKEKIVLEKRLIFLHTNYKYVYYPKKLFSKYELFEKNADEYDVELLKKTKKFFVELMKNQNYKQYRQVQLKHISQNFIIEDYYQALYCFFYNLKKAEKIPIFISDSVDKINKSILKKKLRLVFGNKITIKKEVDSQVEIILTSEVTPFCDIEEFIIYSYQDENTFYRVAQRIQEKIYKQL